MADKKTKNKSEKFDENVFEDIFEKNGWLFVIFIFLKVFGLHTIAWIYLGWLFLKNIIDYGKKTGKIKD